MNPIVESVEPRNVQQIAAAILDLTRMPDDRTHVGNNGRRDMEVELGSAAVLSGIAGRIEALVAQG